MFPDSIKRSATRLHLLWTDRGLLCYLESSSTAGMEYSTSAEMFKLLIVLPIVICTNYPQNLVRSENSLFQATELTGVRITFWRTMIFTLLEKFISIIGEIYSFVSVRSPIFSYIRHILICHFCTSITLIWYRKRSPTFHLVYYHLFVHNIYVFKPFV